MIYVVIGWIGEYSDRTEWITGYVETEDEAKDAVVRFEEDSRRLGELNPDFEHDYEEIVKIHGCLDAVGPKKTGYSFLGTYHRPSYFYSEAEVIKFK